jgi:salicylate hydroxylase
MKDLDVLIIGGGIGGMTTALALQQRGCRVSIFEQSVEFAEVGAGLTLASNAMHVMWHLGLKEPMDRFGTLPDHGAIKHYRTGEHLVDIARGNTQMEKYGAPFCLAHRADVHNALVDAVRANDDQAIHLGREFVDLDQLDDGVIARFSDGSEHSGSLLIGCDGMKSAVRNRLFQFEAPQFTGYVAWRGLVPMDCLDPDVVVPESAMYIGPGHFLTRYPVSGRTQLNYVAVAHTQRWETESWTVRSDVADLKNEFREFAPAVQQIISATPPELCFKWGLFDREPLPEWSRDRVTLAGDAAHPMLPFLGQGAAMAIEDAMLLARAIEAADTIADAFERYELARRERTTFVMLKSRVSGQRLTSANPDDYDASRHQNEETLNLSDYNPVTVSV